MTYTIELRWLREISTLLTPAVICILSYWKWDVASREELCLSMVALIVFTGEIRR